MTPERWRQVDQLLQDALERAPAERAAFIAANCDGDEALRGEVEALLGFDERAESFFGTPPAGWRHSNRRAPTRRLGKGSGHTPLSGVWARAAWALSIWRATRDSVAQSP